MNSHTSHAPLCPHFGECGGCAAQDIPYEEQLHRKAAALQELFAAHWDAPIPVEPSPVLWHYRNKVDLNFGRRYYDTPPPKDFVRETVLGFKRKGRWFHQLDIQECHIAPEGLGPLLEAVRAWARTQHLDGFDTRTHVGLLKNLLVREGRRTGERMAVLITGEGDIDGQSFVDAVLRAYPATSIHRAVTQSTAGVAFAESSETLYGSPYIHEELHIPTESGERRLRFRISPFGFFQTNTLATERLYSLIRRHVAPHKPSVLYDLYGGSGGIALACADVAGRMVSVEEVAAASEDGRHNAAMNGAPPIEFITDKVKNYLKWELLKRPTFEDDSIVIADPPRAGNHPKALRRLIELRPPRIIYIACKPLILARDEMPAFLEHYRIQSIEAIDLFPHTPHTEVVCVLERVG